MSKGRKCLYLQEGIIDSSPPPVARTLSSSCLILNLIKVLRGVIISLSLLFGISSSFPSPSSSQVPQPTCSWKCIPARCMSVGEPDYHPVARPDASPRPRHFCFDQRQVRPRGEGPHHKVFPIQLLEYQTDVRRCRFDKPSSLLRLYIADTSALLT